MFSLNLLFVQDVIAVNSTQQKARKRQLIITHISKNAAILKYVKACLEFVCFAELTRLIKHKAIAIKANICWQNKCKQHVRKQKNIYAVDILKPEYYYYLYINPHYAF